jgi:hypothetical protein
VQGREVKEYKFLYFWSLIFSFLPQGRVIVHPGKCLRFQYLLREIKNRPVCQYGVNQNMRKGQPERVEPDVVVSLFITSLIAVLEPPPARQLLTSCARSYKQGGI